MRIKHLQAAVLIAAIFCVSVPVLRSCYTKAPTRGYSYHFFNLKIVTFVVYLKNPLSVEMLLWYPSSSDCGLCDGRNRLCVLATRLDFDKREWYLQSHVKEGTTVSLYWAVLIPILLAMIRRGFVFRRREHLINRDQIPEERAEVPASSLYR